MSSTSGIQNLLVNVFRPVYTYDATTTLFTPKLELSNVENYSGNTLSVFTIAVGDANSNVYVGSNAGNPYTTLRGCRNVTAIGFGAGSNISNVSNSTFLGFYAGAGATSVTSNVIIGDNASGNGSSNVRIGSSNIGTGSSNISIGAASSSSTFSNVVLLGPGITATQNNQFRVGASYLWGDMGTRWLGIGTSSPADVNNRLDVSGNVYVFGQQGVNMVPIRTLDVNGNFRASDAFGTLDFSNGVTTSSNGFASSQGTTTVSGGVTTIGVLKRGLVFVSVVDTADSANRASRMMFAYTTSAVTDSGSNITAGNTSITLSSSNIQITDATDATYEWSITYFPLP